MENKIHEVLGYTNGHTAMRVLKIKQVTQSDCGLHVQVQLPATRQPDTELAALKGFAHAVISDCWNFTLDAGEIQDLAEQLGLIVPHIITVDEADGDYGVGDTMYQFSDILKENK